MKTLQLSKTKWEELTHELGQKFAKRAIENDKTGTFVFENYEELKSHRYFSAMIPKELGGGGISHYEMCHLIRTMAHYCGSTALAFSMHQHLIAAAVWKYQQQGAGSELLKKVVDHQLVLVSTGARDWLQSNGKMQKMEGGYRFSGRKHFASQSAGGDVAVTSAPFLGTEGAWKVLHFSVPLNANGVSILDDWDVMGMRGTGSQTILFEQVFIPESAISLERSRDGFHPVWNIVLTVAMPLIMAAYVGIAEKAMDIAIDIGKKYHRNQNHITYIIGRLKNSLLSGIAQWEAMCRLANNLDFQPDESNTSDILSYKTNIADATVQTVSLAMEAIGGQSFYRKKILERLFRDVQAGQFHPLPKWDQIAFSGERLLKDN